MIRRAQVVVWVGTLLGAVLVSSSAGQGPPPNAAPAGGKPPGWDKAVEAKQKHANKLLDKPGVVGVGVGLNPAGKPVIKVYKEKADVSDIPDELDDVPVESLVTGVIEARAPTDRFPRPVPIGVSAGHYQLATGTLGVRVTNGANVFALSNNHVFAGINTANIGDPILQPGALEDGGVDPADRIGTLADFQTIDFSGGTNTMDAAIAATTTDLVGTSTPPDGYGAPSPVTALASTGLPVQKYGRTTGFQQGTVVDTNLSVDVCYLFLVICFQEARFAGQISISPGPFSGPGDSGSLIVTQSGNQPVALLFAGGDGLTIGTPIDAVLQRFGVTIDGAPPQNGPPGSPGGVSATPGDGTVSLSWGPPGFDGGSPVTGYRIYRGTSAGGETLHQALGNVTTFVDTGVANGTTYYYRVSAENDNGEGALSTAVSATPTALVAPAEPLPTLDDFGRGFENPLSDGGRWSNGIAGSGESGLYVPSTWLACSKSTTCTSWRNNTQYGPDVEVWARVSVLAGDNNHIRLLARLQGVGTSTYDGYMLRTNQLPGTDQIWLERVDNGALVNRLTINQELLAGDLLLLRVTGSTLEVWRNSSAVWSRLGVVIDTTYSNPGYVGVGLRGTTGRLDDFGARGSSSGVPGAPSGLSATPGDATVSLSWTAPSFDGGSPVTGYGVYRGTSPGEASFLQALGNVTSFADTGAANGTTYYYRVSAVNAVGEGPLSSEASATPAAIVAPAEPLPVVDDFGRGFENPLSDGGRWSNGIAGSGESGLYVPSSWLACSRSTTCTSWRNNTQYGPDVEVWAQVSVLPGDSNHIRLKVRLQGVGTSTYDGYMLRTNQLPGTDQIFLERIDNGAFVNRLTIDQEIAVGDVLLLRAEGSRLEVWRRSTSVWSRLGAVTDSTYAGAGFVGVGLRGTTGRLDDFGARTMGTAPATAPSAPQNLQASAADAQVSLTWSAPASDGGSPLTSYTVYRGQSPNPTGVHASGVASTNYTDLSAANGTTYYYRVTASNLVGESAYSNEVPATPSAPATAPSAPQNLQASAADAQVSLTWSAPASDGGSPLTSYTVYRGQSPNPTGVHASGVASTNYTDLSAANGTTYYYRVTASNLVGESAYSNEASATPSAPATAPSAPQNLQASAADAQVSLTWSAPASDGGSPLTSYTVYRGQSPNPTGVHASGVASTNYTDLSAANGTTYYYRVTASNLVGESAYSNEASATPSAPATAPSAPQNLQASAADAQVSLTWSAPASDGGSPLTSYTVYRGQSPNPTGVHASGVASTNYTDLSAANGTTYYYRVTASNLVGESAYSNEVPATPSAPATAPSAPQNLQASAADAQVSLTWSAPASDGGSPLTSYTVYRGQSPNPTGVHASGVASTNYTDLSAANGTTYYYRVTASNLVGESAYSNEASATPSAPVSPPVEPLPVVDSFNRGSENPLSDGGRWSNGIIGSAETGLRVTSNRLVCTRTTTCTAWRNAAQYGPAAESWARITTLAGTGNSFLLYVRLSQAGAGGSGYRLRTLQQTGTDQVLIERIDTGVIVTRLTMSKELAAGDTLLLRANGPSIEAWHKRGTTWTQLGAVSDSTYQSAGYAGIGIRGKTGRLDDFGAR